VNLSIHSASIKQNFLQNQIANEQIIWDIEPIAYQRKPPFCLYASWAICISFSPTAL